MQPPQDPEGQLTLVDGLLIQEERLIEIIKGALNTVADWISNEMKRFNTKVKAEGKNLQDSSVEELDENLRKQWPRKGRLEVEVYQERKSQITNHNRKYERQVRITLDKFEVLKEEWLYINETIAADFEAFTAQIKRLEDNLPLGKNLAQL